jgi:hypothetical protein
MSKRQHIPNDDTAGEACQTPRAEPQEKPGVFVRMTGQKATDLALILEHIRRTTQGTVEVTRTDAVYFAIRTTADLIRSGNIHKTKQQTKQQRRAQRRKDRGGLRADGTESTRGCPDPWPPGTISLPRAGGR